MDLSKRIIDMYRSDQDARRALIGKWDNLVLNARLQAVDEHNLEFLRAIIGRFGFPPAGSISAGQLQMFLLLIRHADSDVGFQKHCFRLMLPKKLKVPEFELAYLYDRIQVNLGKKQFFGTQFRDNAYGANGPLPILPPIEAVDERRAIVGLPPIAVQKAHMALAYD